MSTLMSLVCNFRWKAHLQDRTPKLIFIGFTEYAVSIENRNQCKTETNLISARKVKFIHTKSVYVYFALAKLINDKLEKVLLS